MVQSDSNDAVYQFQIDGAAPSQAVYQAVAEAKDCDPLDLPPLARVVDTDGLDAFVEAPLGSQEVTCTLEYAGCVVTVTAESVRVEGHRPGR